MLRSVKEPYDYEERPTFTDRIDKLKDRALIDYSYHAEPLREILRKHKAIG
jgi:hypothetical protein